MRAAVAALLLLLVIAQPQPAVKIVVYPSGYARITYYASVTALVPETFKEIGSPQLITAYYTNGTPVPYVSQNGTITLEPPYNGTVTVDYYTESIITKNSLSWTLNISTPYTAVIQLPYNSSLIYINRVPESVSVVNGSILLTVAPGNWSVGYILAPPAQVSPVTQSYQTYYYAIVAAVVVLAVAVSLLVLRRRRRTSSIESLRDLDRQIIRYLKDHGGSAREGEIRQALVIPKTTEWRAIKRLEREGIVKVRKVGKDNVVELVNQ